MIGKKTGGRVKGTPNKATAFSKSVIQDILDGYTTSGQFATDIKLVSPKDRIDIMIKLMSFVTPKPQVDVNITGDKVKTIEEQLKILSEENEQE